MTERSGAQIGADNAASFKAYLDRLSAAGETIPLRAGKPNISAMALACGYDRQVFYKNPVVKRMLEEAVAAFPATEAAEADKTDEEPERRFDRRDQRIMQLEQQNASLRAENLALRDKLRQLQHVEDILVEPAAGSCHERAGHSSRSTSFALSEPRPCASPLTTHSTRPANPSSATWRNSRPSSVSVTPPPAGYGPLSARTFRACSATATSTHFPARSVTTAQRCLSLPGASASPRATSSSGLPRTASSAACRRRSLPSGARRDRRLRANPYIMLALAEWPAVDAAALRLGFDAAAPERLVAAVEAVLYDRYREGHTVMPTAALCAAAQRFLRAGSARALQAVGLALRDGAIFETAAGCQPAGAHVMERYVGRRVDAMLDKAGAGDLFAQHVPDAEFADWLQRFRNRTGVDLDPEQREAIRLGVNTPFGMITGGAGVGKTTVLRALCDACEAFGRPVHLMALAGRAAVRVREATGRPASTIAAFLGQLEAEQIELGPESLLVLDEASMVDLPTFYACCATSPKGARMLLVGDPGQLPPIGFGLVMHALAEDPRVPKVELTRVYRQTESTGIPAVARSVRAGVLPKLPDTRPKPNPRRRHDLQGKPPAD